MYKFPTHSESLVCSLRFYLNYFHVLKALQAFQVMNIRINYDLLYFINILLVIKKQSLNSPAGLRRILCYGTVPGTCWPLGGPDSVGFAYTEKIRGAAWVFLVLGFSGSALLVGNANMRRGAEAT